MRVLVIGDDCAALAVVLAERLGGLVVIEGQAGPAVAPSGARDAMPVRLTISTGCLEPPLPYIGEGKRTAQWKAEIGRHRRR